MDDKRHWTNVRLGPLLALLTLLVGAIAFLAVPAGAETPSCASSASDSDGDGWGWENNASCRVVEGTSAPANSNPTPNQRPTCASPDSDPDGDGFGFENNATCLVAEQTPAPAPAPSPAPVPTPTAIDTPTRIECNNDFDPDGDGFGFENNQSCAHRPPVPTNFQMGTFVQTVQALFWDPVPGAEGYVLYANGEPFSVEDTSIWTGDLVSGTNYYVRSFTPGMGALSHPSRPLQWNGELFVDPDTDNFNEFRCRSGAAGENNPATGFGDRFPLVLFTVNNGDIIFEPTTAPGAQFFQADVFYTLDCDAERHVVEFQDDQGRVINTTNRDGDGDLPGFHNEVGSRPSRDIDYRLVVTSFFHDGDVVESQPYIISVPGR